MQDCLIIIPTYNEKENIGKIIPFTLALSERFHILVVEDGSPDGTADVVKSLMQQYPGRVHILERKGKLGLGTAYIAGFRWALERTYQFIFEMDADFSHNPNDLMRLLEACEKQGGQLSIGSRYVKGGGVENWPWDRLFLSSFASKYVRIITGMPVSDTTAGFVCYRRETLQGIDLNKIKFVGYTFQVEMKFAAWLNGFRIIEVPIIFKDREVGVSKMSGKIIKEAVTGVIKIKWRSLLDKSAYRVKQIA
ncbi:MAG: polyprenol monophosphomannose synthase [Chitinophagales bacterium]|jgi:dolichol-phosphate mannosyltransferase|nr:polyprenol monophosphomannose synthase [Chitinophagales bacterium]